MDNENKENEEVVTPATDEGKTSEPSQTRTEKDKALFTFKKVAEKLNEFGVDPKTVLGVTKENGEVPEWYKQEKAKEQTQNALQMAESLADAETREQVKTYLKTRIVPSGNPTQDFKDALGAVSAAKNKQIVEEMARATSPKVVASGGSSDPTKEEEFTPTEQESIFMKPPYNMSKEKILEARKKAEMKAQ